MEKNVFNNIWELLKEYSITANFSHLSREKGPILELAQEEGNKETAQHEAHGEQGSVGVRLFDSGFDNSRVTGGVVIEVLLDHHWVPGIFY